MTLADYLAKNYLSADPKPSKKRKRKQPPADATAGLTITDDNLLPELANPNGENDDDGDDAPTIVGSAPLTSGLNKPKKSKWLRIGATAPSDADQLAADAILASAQAESAARAAQDVEDAPMIVDTAATNKNYNNINNNDEDDEQHDPASRLPTMASGAAAGLQTAAQVSAALRRKEKSERQAMKDAGLDPSGLARTTIYRDASGRRINVQAARDEASRKEQEALRKQQEELEARKGDVQRREKEERRRELDEARTLTVARGADDVAMNEELKMRERWNDPMAQMLTKKGGGGGGGGGRSAEAKGQKAKGKTYQGAFEPNRYGVRPGWRWDGVDRGNGFERKWFAARNRARDRQDLEYAWQLDE